jgi:DNA-3-methyladenine glycosylase
MMDSPIQAKALSARQTWRHARELLGCVLVRRRGDGSVTRHIITETEAYHGERDRACHASKGRTARTEVMYGPAGRWYVYLCYGVHEMLNLVTGPEGFPAAVLIRGLHDVEGPGKLTRRLEIGRELNGESACDAASGLWIEPREAGGVKFSRRQIVVGPRVGVDYAGQFWAGKPWRFRAEV